MQAKDDWITYLSNNHHHNTLDKWLERLKLHNDTPSNNVLISPSPSSSSSSDAKVSPAPPITAIHQPPPSPSFSSFSDNNSHSTPLANVFHTLVARRKSAAVLQNQRRRMSFVAPSLIAPAASQNIYNQQQDHYGIVDLLSHIIYNLILLVTHFEYLYSSTSTLLICF